MREIKFRAWDKEKKRMVSDIVIDTTQWSLNRYILELQKHYDLMQYTGLKDKNGKEIYEGDIIDFGGLKPIEIVWRDNGFKTKLIPYEDSEPINLTQEGLSAFGEIIGNIYENKDLLK